MQNAIDGLGALRTELENIDYSSWDEIEIWGVKAGRTIMKNWSEHLEEFRELLKKPKYPSGGSITYPEPRIDAARYIIDPRAYQRDLAQWRASQVKRQQAEKDKPDIFRLRCDNSHRKLLAFLDGLIHEAGNSDTPPNTTVQTYVNPERINELQSVVKAEFDLTKLIQLCKELNICSSNEAYFATLMLVRSILDHVPPIFSCKSFSEVANNYPGGTKSFKEVMQRLESTSRKIADSFLHSQVRKSETLPNSTQVKFDSEIDFLLGEIYRLLK
jgi:hypothetical protein